MVNIKHAHIIGISETHVHKDISDREIEIAGFYLHRSDCKTGTGGGVAAYVNE